MCLKYFSRRSLPFPQVITSIDASLPFFIPKYEVDNSQKLDSYRIIVFGDDVINVSFTNLKKGVTERQEDPFRSGFTKNHQKIVQKKMMIVKHIVRLPSFLHT